jgi:hypothetical protein
MKDKPREGKGGEKEGGQKEEKGKSKVELGSKK